MDELDCGAVPHCPADGIVMRDMEGGWMCPACDYVLAPVMHITMPPPFRGPSIHDGPRYDDESSPSSTT